MPVMGPDMDAARQEGHKVGEKLLAALIEEHHLFDVTNERYEGSGLFFLPKAKQRWAAAKEAFVKAVGELFSEDAANSF